MTEQFFLYDRLVGEITDTTDLKESEKSELIDRFKEIDLSGRELVYAVIKAYQMKHDNPKNTLHLPYEGKAQKTGVKFDLEKFPNRLKRMIVRFVEMHILKMEEEKERDG